MCNVETVKVVAEKERIILRLKDASKLKLGIVTTGLCEDKVICTQMLYKVCCKSTLLFIVL